MLHYFLKLYSHHERRRKCDLVLVCMLFWSYTWTECRGYAYVYMLPQHAIIPACVVASFDLILCLANANQLERLYVEYLCRDFHRQTSIIYFILR